MSTIANIEHTLDQSEKQAGFLAYHDISNAAWKLAGAALATGAGDVRSSNVFGFPTVAFQAAADGSDVIATSLTVPKLMNRESTSRPRVGVLVHALQNDTTGSATLDANISLVATVIITFADGSAVTATAIASKDIDGNAKVLGTGNATISSSTDGAVLLYFDLSGALSATDYALLQEFCTVAVTLAPTEAVAANVHVHVLGSGIFAREHFRPHATVIK